MGPDIDYDMSPFLAPAVRDGQGYGGTGAPVAYGMLGFKASYFSMLGPAHRCWVTGRVQ